jgi:hypothetical protein
MNRSFVMSTMILVDSSRSVKRGDYRSLPAAWPVPSATPL